MPAPTYIQVFEHQTLRVAEQGLSERHLRAMAAFNARHGHRYFTTLHGKVRFHHYVGVLQVGDLCIEVLPKTDRHAEAAQWQQVLLQLLYHCGVLPHYTLSEASLRLQRSPLLLLYLDCFADSIRDLLHVGLLKQYRQQDHNGPHWKGRINFARQLQKNWRHPERVYSRRQVYDYGHPAHQVLSQALQAVLQTALPAGLRQRFQHLERAFPKLPPRRVDEGLLQALLEQPQLARYHRALELARLILLQYSPDVRVGQHHLLALLFDMNQLFERYLERQLQHHLDDSWTLRAQASRPFWANRRLRPDFWLQQEQQHYILDAKWKILKRPEPSDADLRQMFAYNHSFQATKSVLIYPNVFALPPRQAPFAAPILIDGQWQSHTCQVVFVDILNPKGQLNTKMAAQLMAQIQTPILPS